MTKASTKISLVVAAAALSAACGTAGNPLPATRAVSNTAAAQAVIPGRAVVKVRPGQHLRLRQDFGAQIKEVIPQLGLSVVELPAGKTAADVRKELGASALYVEEDRPASIIDPIDVLTAGGNPQVAPNLHIGVNDPEADKQWAIGKVNYEGAWAKSSGGSDKVVIAIVDTGADLKHPDLKDKLVKGYNATGPGGLFGWGDPIDDNGHGTHCSGIAAAIVNNGVGVAGLAENCKIMPVKVLAGAGSGSLLGVAKGIIAATDKNADVISMSLGGAGTTSALQEAVEYALKHNVVVVAAMGNAGHTGNPISYPAAYPGVIAVGATDQDDKITFFSSFGKWCSVSSPGWQIFSSTPTYDCWLTKNSGGKITKNYSYMSGTSMATPLVSGLVGLIRSQHPGMAPKDVKALLEKSAVKTAGMNGADHDDHYGYGRIDAAAAVAL